MYPVMSNRLASACGFALLCVVAAASASAADLGPITKAPPVPVVYSWTGCYLGIEGGGNWGRSSHTAVGAPNPANAGLPITNDFNLSGGMVGGTIGCNYQLGDWVIGIENDASWTNKSGSANDIPPFNVLTVSHTGEDWIDTLRGRIGFAWNRALVYGTGGAAFAGTTVTVCPPLAPCVNDSQSRVGWVAGAGLEFAVWETLSVKLEYLHADFGTARYINPSVVTTAGGTIVTRDVTLTDDMVRAGLNWRFF
jgi:outer membrane immunogenic protein